MRFPTIETHDLDGKHVAVPDDLPGNPRIILLPFQRWHQALVDGWSLPIRSLAEAYPQLTVWEVPTMARAYLAGRFFIDGGMRAAIPDEGGRQHTLTAYTDVPALVRALELQDTETVHVYLLDAEGRIVWTGSGQVSEEQFGQLATATNAMMAGVSAG